MNRYECWWCRIFYSKLGPFCFYKEKLHKVFTECDVVEMEKIADKLYDKVRDINIEDSNPEIQGDNIQFNRSTERFRNLSMRALPQQTEQFISFVNPMLTYGRTSIRHLSDYLNNAQNSNFEKLEGSSGSSFSFPSSGELFQEGDKPNPSEDSDLGSKEEPLYSASVSPIFEKRKEIAVLPKNTRYFRSVSSSSVMETPIDGSSVKENESSEEVVEGDSVADAEAVSVAGPSGLIAQPLRKITGKRFECDVTTCRQAFRDRYALEQHRRTHTGKKPFVCDICNKEFSQKGNLKNHEATHTGEKTFQCQICLQKFGLKGNLKKHLQTHLDKKPFVCSICSKGFTQNCHLKRHLLIHSDGKTLCPIFTKRFKWKYCLEVYLQTDERERP